MKIKQIIEKIVPEYAWMPLFSMLLLNFVTYIGTRLITSGRRHYDFASILDLMIPLCPVFVLFYVGAFLQWVLVYLRIAREGRRFCYQTMYGECIAKLLTLICFLLIPTSMARPRLTGSDFFTAVLKFIYRMDAADNLFPSIHCLESIICMHAVLQMKKVPAWFRPGNIFMSIAVCMSTVLVKQHVVADVAGAILIAELGLMTGKHLFRSVKEM